MALTPDEDADLFRLALLEKFGLLRGDSELRLADLRRRDRRTAVREPRDVVDPQPAKLRVGVRRDWGR